MSAAAQAVQSGHDAHRKRTALTSSRKMVSSRLLRSAICCCEERPVQERSSQQWPCWLLPRHSDDDTARSGASGARGCCSLPGRNNTGEGMQCASKRNGTLLFLTNCSRYTDGFSTSRLKSVKVLRKFLHFSAVRKSERVLSASCCAVALITYREGSQDAAERVGGSCGAYEKRRESGRQTFRRARGLAFLGLVVGRHCGRRHEASLRARSDWLACVFPPLCLFRKPFWKPDSCVLGDAAARSDFHGRIGGTPPPGRRSCTSF